MILVLNGRVTIGTNLFWRIDNLDEAEQVRLGFLTNPWALVRDEEAAKTIIATLNRSEEKP